MDTIPGAELTNSRIVAAFRERTPESARLSKEAADLLPSGIAHDARQLEPYNIYVARASGPRKWDVDGNEYVDYFGGHGALLLGHCHPVVMDAVSKASQAGTHFGSNHPGEIAWAKAIRELVPSAERVRFTSSGTEATLMALRLARAFTGRQTLIRLKGHFHGWHDHMTSGYTNHFDGSPTPGVLPGVAEKVVLIEPNNVEQLRATLSGSKDIAAVVLEPTGSSFGQVPIRPEFLAELRRSTESHGALLIFDEVVTGFRVSRGGAQVAFDIRPDLSSFAKIVAGGLPGAAVAGRRDILELLDFAATERAGREKIAHPGTFNANPVSAAAGTACLGVIRETDVNDRADRTAADLRAALNEVIAAEGLPWAVYGTFSGFHLFVNPKNRPIQASSFDPYGCEFDELKSQPKALMNKLRLALLANGVDVNGRIGGFLSATHGPDEVAHTAEAFRASIAMLRAEAELA